MTEPPTRKKVSNSKTLFNKCLSITEYIWQGKPDLGRDNNIYVSIHYTKAIFLSRYDAQCHLLYMMYLKEEKKKDAEEEEDGEDPELKEITISLIIIYYCPWILLIVLDTISFSHTFLLLKKSQCIIQSDISFECQILWTSAANSWNTKQHNLKPTTMFIKYCRLGLSHILCEKVMLPQEGKDLTFSKIKSQYQLEHIHLIWKLKCDLRFN